MMSKQKQDTNNQEHKSTHTWKHLQVTQHTCRYTLLHSGGETDYHHRGSDPHHEELYTTLSEAPVPLGGRGRRRRER